MHGIGNDYIYINCFAEQVSSPQHLSMRMSPRHFSVGADGLVLICPSSVADAKMRMFNADGSEGRMCGNAIRCVGKYLFESGIAVKTDLTIETLSGIKQLHLNVVNNCVETVTVAMGIADFTPSALPINADSCQITLDGIDNASWELTCVSMGNPHAVTYVEDPASLPLERLGSKFENHPLFPERVNTEFVHILNPTMLMMRVWERGSGETYACGTGACAAVAASVKNGYCPANTPITVCLTGGQLTIVCTDDNQIFMTGSATKVFEGIYEYDEDQDQ